MAMPSGAMVAGAGAVSVAAATPGGGGGGGENRPVFGEPCGAQGFEGGDAIVAGGGGDGHQVESRGREAGEFEGEPAVGRDGDIGRDAAAAGGADCGEGRGGRVGLAVPAGEIALRDPLVIGAAGDGDINPVDPDPALQDRGQGLPFAGVLGPKGDVPEARGEDGGEALQAHAVCQDGIAAGPVDGGDVLAADARVPGLDGVEAGEREGPGGAEIPAAHARGQGRRGVEAQGIDVDPAIGGEGDDFERGVSERPAARGAQAGEAQPQGEGPGGEEALLVDPFDIGGGRAVVDADGERAGGAGGVAAADDEFGQRGRRVDGQPRIGPRRAGQQEEQRQKKKFHGTTAAIRDAAVAARAAQLSAATRDWRAVVLVSERLASRARAKPAAVVSTAMCSA